MEVYLDNAATSHPKPPQVLAAVNEALTTLNANPGRSGHKRALAGARLMMEARQALADLIHAPESECVAFCYSCTDALNTAIKGSLRAGDHVLASLLEHNSVLRVLMELENRGLISVTLTPPREDGRIHPDDLLRALQPNTRLCVLTHASNVTGIVQPVEEAGRILRPRGVRFLVDGAQAIGHLPVNVQTIGCDLYAFPGHKGLLGPQGTGGLYIAPGLPLRPFREGGTGSGSDSMLQPTERPECFESGTVNLPGIAGLLAGARLAAEDMEARRGHEAQLTARLMDGLAALPRVRICGPANTRHHLGVVSFNMEGIPSSELSDRLDGMGIAVRGGIHCAPGAHQWLGTLRQGAVRASVGWKTTPEDIDSLLNALKSIG